MDSALSLKITNLPRVDTWHDFLSSEICH